MPDANAVELQRLAARCEEVRQIALSQGYSSTLITELAAMSCGHATTTIKLEFNSAFRARKLAGDYRPQNLNEMWHPPAHLLKSFGRANLPYNPVLYCSNDEITALRETGAGLGDRVCFMEMGRLNNQQLHIFVLGELVHRFRTRKSLIGGALDDVIEKLAHMNLHLERALLIDGFYADAFRTLGDALYPLTVAITQSFMRPDEIDGIAYPSVFTPETGLNLALKPQCAMRLLSVRRVKIVRIESRFGERFKGRLENLSRFLNPDGSILWQFP